METFWYHISWVVLENGSETSVIVVIAVLESVIDIVTRQYVLLIPVNIQYKIDTCVIFVKKMLADWIDSMLTVTIWLSCGLRQLIIYCES